MQLGSWTELVSGVITGLALVYTLLSDRRHQTIKFKVTFIPGAGINRSTGKGRGFWINVKNTSRYQKVQISLLAICVKTSNRRRHILPDSIPVVGSEPNLYRSDEDATLIPGQTYFGFVDGSNFAESVNRVVNFDDSLNKSELQYIAIAQDRSGQLRYTEIKDLGYDWFMSGAQDRNREITKS
ncbi:hypothetical protein [Lacticaseibacillus hegangensis]|uniref:Uncharacterized protein n=1 Tax=Lacticaseibacillus hegangensis TaxID=2486010 RepID=A0ABW4CZ38_9LACO|nr:hypothetical protein [Lacticaseibacillus hegangensis]